MQPHAPALPPPWGMAHLSDPETLAVALAGHIGAALRSELDHTPRAVLILSGGTTPRRLFSVLAQAALPWSRVTIWPADERAVPITHPRSNTGALQAALRGTPAEAAELIDMSVPDAGSVDAVAAALSDRWAQGPAPAAVTILGMGLDGHTASLFPDAAALDRGLDPAATPGVLVISAPGAPEPRLSLNLPALTASRLVALHIEGDEKLKVLTRALAQPAPTRPPAAETPIGRLARAMGSRLSVFWCPDPS